MADKTFFEIEIDTKQAQKDLEELRKHAQMCKDEFDGGLMTQEEYTRNMKSMEVEARALESAIKANKTELSASSREANAAKGSYNQLSAEYTRLKAEMNALDPQSTKWKQMAEQAKQVHDQMNELQKATGNYSLQVGNYKIATEGLVDAFKKEFAATGSVKAGLKAVGTEMKALIANPIGIAIMAVVTAFEAFKTVLNSTAIGQEKWAKVTGTVKGALLGIKEVLLQVGPLLADFFTGNWSELKNDWQKTKDAFTNILNVAQQTGEISAERQKLVQEEAEIQKKVAGYDKQLAELEGQIRKAKKDGLDTSKIQAQIEDINTKKYDEQIKLAQKKYNLKKQENSLTSSTAEDLAEETELETEITRLQTEKQRYLNGLVRYQTKLTDSSKEDAKAQEEARKAEEERLKIAKERLELSAQSEKSLYDYLNPDERDKRYQEEEKAYEEARKNLGNMQIESAEEINALVEDLERKHQANMLAIDKEIADEQQKLTDKDYAEKKKLGDKATADAIKRAEKQKESEMNATQDVIKGFQELTSANSSNSKAMFKANKALQSSSATMEAARAVIKVWSDGNEPYYVKLAESVALAASLAGQLSTIKNTEYGGGGSSSSSSVTTSTSSDVSSTILGRYAQNYTNAKNTQYVLVVDEVTAKQQEYSNDQKVATI